MSTAHAISDANLDFVIRFLPAFLAGQPSNGPFSFLHDLEPTRVSMEGEGDGVEVGDYRIQVRDHPTKKLGLTPHEYPAPQYDVTLGTTDNSTAHGQPGFGEVMKLGQADTFFDALLLILTQQVHTHANAMLDGWEETVPGESCAYSPKPIRKLALDRLAQPVAVTGEANG